MLFVLNVSVSVNDSRALRASANSASQLPEDRSSLHPGSNSDHAVEAAMRVEAVVVNALNAAGCTANWIRVDCIKSSSGPPDFEDLDVAFLADEGSS